MGRILTGAFRTVNSKKHAGFQLATFKTTGCFSEQYPLCFADSLTRRSGAQDPGDKTA